MENKALESVVAIEGSELKNSQIDNSVKNGGTTNNYYSGCQGYATPQNTPSDYAQLRAQLDRMKQTLNFILQAVINKN